MTWWKLLNSSSALWIVKDMYLQSFKVPVMQHLCNVRFNFLDDFKKKLFESVKNMWSAHWTNYVCKSGIHSTVQPRERKEIFCSLLYIFLAYFDKSVCQGGLHCYTEFDCSLRLCRYTVFYNVLFFSVRTFSLWPWRSVHNSGQVLKFL